MSDVVTPVASAIVRVKNEAGTLVRALESLRTQTAAVEIVVVDSGSTDGTLDVARRFADRVVEIPAESFTYGYSLNIGAANATGPVHFALSAHCEAPDDRWVERSLEHYRDPSVAGACGATFTPGGEPLGGPRRQSLDEARSVPLYGFSNHGSSWRAAAWREHPFNEALDYAEDKEWALRVLAAGYNIVLDPAIYVDMSHQWRGTHADRFTRERRCYRAIGTFNSIPSYPLTALLRDCVARRPGRRRSLHEMAAFAGRYVGTRQARSLSSHAPPV